MTSNRLQTVFGNVRNDSQLTAFVAYYRFQDRTYSIRVWAHDWPDAERYCTAHGMRLMGKLVEEME